MPFGMPVPPGDAGVNIEMPLTKSIAISLLVSSTYNGRFQVLSLRGSRQITRTVGTGFVAVSAERYARTGTEDSNGPEDNWRS
jgi:hypothetical protein